MSTDIYQACLIMSNRWEIPESDGSIPKYIVDLMQHV